VSCVRSRLAALLALLAVAACTAATSPQPPPGPPRRDPLPLRPDGHGEVRPTPPELVDRRLTAPDLLPPPADGAYKATIAPVPDAVLARSTWTPDCPVTRADLRYLTVGFRGFDGKAHTGELLVNARVAEDVTRVFGELFKAGFPIEEMRVVRRDELDAPPTGDDDNTTAFVCRKATGLANWSAHAYGLAIDVNPFQNPYTKGDLVLPELSSAYLDRGAVRPGMIFDGGPVVAAFRRIGWTWGGHWHEPVDRQHFSETGK
jgi:hypothetical protein